VELCQSMAERKNIEWRRGRKLPGDINCRCVERKQGEF